METIEKIQLPPLKTTREVFLDEIIESIEKRDGLVRGIFNQEGGVCALGAWAYDHYPPFRELVDKKAVPDALGPLDIPFVDFKGVYEEPTKRFDVDVDFVNHIWQTNDRFHQLSPQERKLYMLVELNTLKWLNEQRDNAKLE